ncbi:hypothetical protein RRG08_048298 [Elysia crispata]|uniref:Uncharacterized protein n=1 Tax=Elysia crispata TaxID=231223 RepID=A0AAE0ZT30_9GAST|nr:hypothetical protein RRG08_048298 [Elysia crispata]
MLADSHGRTFRIVTRPASGVKRLGVSPAGLSVILSPVKRDIEVDPSTTVQGPLLIFDNAVGSREFSVLSMDCPST